MANLKEKILQALKSTKQVETTLNTIAKLQENLLKNYSNPVFNKKDKNKILKSYSNLQDVGWNDSQKINTKGDIIAKNIIINDIKKHLSTLLNI